jgi:hypothetical protein
MDQLPSDYVLMYLKAVHLDDRKRDDFAVPSVPTQP